MPNNLFTLRSMVESGHPESLWMSSAFLILPPLDRCNTQRSGRTEFRVSNYFPILIHGPQP